MYQLTLKDYLITKNGEIINKKTKRILKGDPNAKGYLRVSIGGKKHFIHRLVAEQYIPNPLNKQQINHINGIKTDNRVENLEWVTNLENRQHAIKKGLHCCGEKCSWSKLKEKDVIFIRTNKLLNTKELAEKFNVSEVTIRDVINFKSWKNIKS